MTKLSTLFEKNKIGHVNFFSLDVEGAEYSVLQSIQWDRVVIDVFCVEIVELPEYVLLFSALLLYLTI